MGIQIQIQLFYLNANPDPGSQTNADPNPDPGQTLSFKKVEFLHEKYTSVDSKSWKIYLRYTVDTKAFLKGDNSGLFVNFIQLTPWIRIRIKTNIPRNETACLVPVSVSNLYIPMMGLPILLQSFGTIHHGIALCIT